MKRNTGLRMGSALVAVASFAAFAVAAQDENIFAEYRAMFGDDNPAELVEMQGQELWSAERGPNKLSLAKCDLGLGPGVVKGSFAQLPRYFKDANRVMDLETRLLWCMEKIQGIEVGSLRKRPFSVQGQPQTELESLSAYIAGQSRGIPVAVPQVHALEIASFQSGQRLFNYRAGPHDFSCATCHSQEGKRIRLQALPQLNSLEGARSTYSTWPAYRISEGAVRTMEWRLADCFRQQRLPGLVLGSPAAIDLTTYLGVQAAGAPMAAPGLKR